MDEFTEIVILRQHLERWHQWVRWAHGHFEALDLADNYRDGRPNAQYSKVTRGLARMVEQLEGYLDNVQEEEDDDA